MCMDLCRLRHGCCDNNFSYTMRECVINNKGLNMIICWAPREVLKPEPERQGFQHLPRVPADVNASKKHV